MHNRSSNASQWLRRMKEQQASPTKEPSNLMHRLSGDYGVPSPDCNLLTVEDGDGENENQGNDGDAYSQTVSEHYSHSNDDWEVISIGQLREQFCKDEKAATTVDERVDTAGCFVQEEGNINSNTIKELICSPKHFNLTEKILSKKIELKSSSFN